MKSLFSRLRHKDPSQPSSSSHTPSNSDSPSSSRPTSRTSTRPASTSRTTSASSAHPIITTAPTTTTASANINKPLPSPALVPLHHSPSSSSESDLQPISQRASGDGELGGLALPVGIWQDGRVWDTGGGTGGMGGGKKVTFRSPVPTPTTSLVLDEIPPPSSKSTPSSLSPSTADLPPSLRPPSSSSEPRTRKPSNPAPIVTAVRKSSLPASSCSSPAKSGGSILSPTPSEASSSGARSYLPPPNSWSEMAEEELIANLGPKERTRQEVLWEIVSSEERYVQELIKLTDTFAHALLPPSSHSPNLASPTLHSLARTFSPLSTPPLTSPSSPTTDSTILPIAARYATTSSAASRNLYSPPIPEEPTVADDGLDPRKDAYNALTSGRPGRIPKKPSFLHASSFGHLGHGRSHQSLPPPQRDRAASAQQSRSDARMSYHPGNTVSGHHKLTKGRVASAGSINDVLAKDVQLPEDLRTVLQVLSGEVLDGHIKLAEALRKRYEDQYPLVRSLADVFTAHSYILKAYSTYVFHLESALSTVDTALHLAAPSASSSPFSNHHHHNTNPSKRLSTSPLYRLGRTLLALDEISSEKGEAGLSISLSKPFQRLLKYPLLFQNLLFNTDPSLREYEKTLEMVDEVEGILRVLEDEKTDWEKRERTRDCWARIDGLERDKMLVAPKPNRLLEDESQLPAVAGDVKMSAMEKEMGNVKGKKSFRRLSDILKTGEKHELWTIRFSDVSLLCYKTGTTSLPISSSYSLPRGKDQQHTSRSDSLPELSGRGKYATTGRRGTSIKPRNLYRFIKVHEWHLEAKHESTEALVSMEDITKARRESLEPKLVVVPVASPPTTPRKTLIPSPSTPNLGSPTPTKVPLKGQARRLTPRRDADAETVVSDRLSVMSFAFTSDNVKPLRARIPKSSAPPIASSSAATTRNVVPPGVVGQRDAGRAQEAKFGARLRSPDGEATVRPASRARRSLPPAMANRPIHPPGDPLRSKSPNSNSNGRTTPLQGERGGNVAGVTKREWTGNTVPMKPRVAGSRIGGEQRRSVVREQDKVARRGAGGGGGGSADSGVAGLWNPEMEDGADVARGGRI